MIALVAYATKHGSTREVADAIGERLRERGFGVDVMEARATPADLSGYDLVVLGGALYIGRWHHDAVAFLKQHRSELALMPLAVFGMGPAKDAKPAFDAARVQLDHSLARAAVTPELTAVFGGVVQPKRLRFPFSWMPASDARDWAAIESFAKQAAELAGSRASTDGTWHA